jgi:ribosome hibernation promoting factor
MRLELTGRHIDITPSLRRIVDAKLAKLDRLLNDSAVSAQVVLTREKFRRGVEITLHARGENFLHSVGSSETWEQSLAQAVVKIAHQAEKVKGKWQERKRAGVRRAPRTAEQRAASPKPAGRPAPKMPQIFRASRQAIRLMSVADAAREIDRRGDGLVIFRDPERTSVSVLYRQANGELRLVETDT